MTKLVVWLWFLVSLLPFAGTVWLARVARAADPKTYPGVYLVYMALFWALGVIVHSVAPIYLLNAHFDTPAKKPRILLLCIAPVAALVGAWLLITTPSAG